MRAGKYRFTLPEREACVQNTFTQTQNFLSREISIFSAWLFLATTLAVLAGCGSGQAIPSLPAPAPPPAPGATPAAIVQLLVSSPQMPSAGTTTVDLTAVVLSATKQAIAGRTVNFSTPALPETAFVNNISAAGVSDANGIVTAKLNLGTLKANRAIAVSATADSATGNNSVDVTGTTITISGNSSLALGNTTTLTFTVKDSAGTAIPGVALSLASATGNTIALKPGAGITCASTSVCNTDSSGQLKADVTAAVATTPDTITATGGGTAKTQLLAINSASFNFTQPALAAGATSVDVPLNTATKVAIKWTNVPAIPTGTQVNFSTTRGAITNLTPDCLAPSVAPGGAAVTDGAGNACVSITSALAGPAIVTAAGVPAATSPAATLNIVFVSQSAANVTVQAVPGTVGVTTDSTSQTNNVSTITAVVRDGPGNLVKNAGITFSLNDPTAGTLSSGTARTDVSGSASVTYTAGRTSSPANGVAIKATVTDITAVGAIPPVSSCTLVAGTSNCPAVPPAPEVAGFPDATLTVASQPLLVRLGTDNLVGGAAPVNTKTYIATVTDAAGNPVVGATVRFSLRPGHYAKGVHVVGVVGTTSVWVQQINAICNNEDINFNGNLDGAGTPGSEDFNGNGRLDPGGSATVNAVGTTDAAGNATATITYPKDHSRWTEVILEARTGVVGNDPPTTATFYLLGLASDYKDVSVDPPGKNSPYGVAFFCNDPN